MSPLFQLQLVLSSSPGHFLCLAELQGLGDGEFGNGSKELKGNLSPSKPSCVPHLPHTTPSEATLLFHHAKVPKEARGLQVSLVWPCRYTL